MKKITVFILVLLALQTKAQIVVGDTSSNGVNYYNIIDTTIGYGYRAYSGSIYCLLDLNNDSNFDIKVEYGNNGGISYSTYHTYIESIGNTDLCTLPTSSNWIDTLTKGDIINEFSSWHTCIPKCTIYYYYSGSVPPPGSSNNSGVFKGNSKYLGYRIINGIDTTYGWVLCNAQFLGLTIRSFAYKGNHINSIIQQAFENFFVYPNPAKDFMYIQSWEAGEIQEISLLDISGKSVLSSQVINSKTKEIDLRNLSNGVYFLRVRYRDGVVVKKIIVEH